MPEETPPERISISTFGDFFLDYRAGKYPNLRFGQAFLNAIYPDVADRALYYEENEDKAIEIIHNDYVDIFLPYGDGKVYKFIERRVNG